MNSTKTYAIPFHNTPKHDGPTSIFPEQNRDMISWPARIAVRNVSQAVISRDSSSNADEWRQFQLEVVLTSALYVLHHTLNTRPALSRRLYQLGKHQTHLSLRSAGGAA
jgi:hypothetical protein